MSEPKIFDLKAAMMRVDDDRDLLKELIDIFLGDEARAVEAIAAAVSAADPVALKDSAHAIKSGLGNLGAMRCHGAALELEMLGRSETTAGAAELFSNFKKELDLFRAEALAFKAKA